MFRSVFGVVLAIAALVSSSAHAEEGSLYLGGNAGINFFSDTTSKGASGIDVENSYNNGYMLSGVVGYMFGNGLRAEGELAYRRNGIDRFTTVSAGGTTIAIGNDLDASGSVSTASLMGNIAYDISTGTDFTPYVIGGLGATRVSVNSARVAGVLLSDDENTVFSYQIGAGVGYALTKRFTLDLGYRYFATDDPELTDDAGGIYHGEIEAHNVTLGLRYAF